MKTKFKPLQKGQRPFKGIWWKEVHMGFEEIPVKEGEDVKKPRWARRK